MYHPLCPRCRSFKTVKFGVPRWKCNHCGFTFRIRNRRRKYRAAIEGYVGDRTAYVRLGRRQHIHKSTAYRRVQRALSGRMTLLERTKKYLKRCDGVLVLDGKHLRIGGKRYTLFVAWDRGFGRPVHFLLREGGEGDMGYWRLLIDLKRLGYPFSGFISDGITSLRELLADYYPDLPHQRCTVHVFLAARSKVAVGKRVSERAKDFIDLLHEILWSPTIASAKSKLKKVWGIPYLTSRERQALEYLWPILPQCFVSRDKRWNHLRLPRSSNAIENVIGQLEARFKTMRGLKNVMDAERLINELLLRVKRQVINQ